MSALLQLHRALAAKDTLPWVLKHAPDGDRDKALRCAWLAERSVRTLARFAWDYHPLARFNHPNRGLVDLASWCLCKAYRVNKRSHLCAACVQRIRAVLPPPTWSEVERADAARRVCEIASAVLESAADAESETG